MKLKDARILDNISLYIFSCIFCSSFASIIISYFLLYFGSFNISIVSICHRFFISILMCLLFGTIVSSVVGRKSNAYVTDIAHAIREIANGNFNYQLSVKDKIIFKDVATSFNVMAKELSSMEILRQDFIANFSHEFRTPINSIAGYAELLKNNGIDEKERNEYIDVIINESKRLFSLADNILYLSNLRTSSRLPDISTYRLDEQIRQVLLVYEKKWSEKKIDFEFDMDDIMISARKEFLHQMFGNLISNAIKFTKDSIILSLHQIDNEVVFAISDNGIGMDEEVRKHIFDMFYQADVSHNSGSGLGLAIVKKLADLCDYAIEIESKPSLGTKFIIHIPVLE